MIFISHSSKQAQAAADIVREIESRGGRCWIAPRDISKAGTYAGQIIEAIKKCHTMLVLVSCDSVASPQVEREVERAIHYQRRLMVVRLEDVTLCGDMEYYLSAVQWFPATQGLDQEVLGRILAALPEQPPEASDAAVVTDAPAALKGAATKAGQVVVELSSAGKLQGLLAVHHASNLAMNAIAFKDAAVVSWRLQPAAIWFVMQKNSFAALQRHFLSKALENTTGIRWSKCQIVATAPNTRPVQTPVYLVDSYCGEGTCVTPRSVVCFLGKIAGCEDEWVEANAILGPVTESLEQMEVYITQNDEFLYAHGNYRQQGAIYPTKVAVNFPVSLTSLVMNMVFRPPVSDEDECELLRHVQNSIKFYINQDKLTITDPAFYGGALNVEFVADHPAILRLRSERAKDEEELRNVLERQRDVLGSEAEDTVLTARRIEELLVGRVRGSHELPEGVAENVARVLAFLEEIHLPPSIYTVEVAYRAGLRDTVRPLLAGCCQQDVRQAVELVKEVEGYDRTLAHQSVIPDLLEVLAAEKGADAIRVRAELWGKVKNTTRAFEEYRLLIRTGNAVETDYADAAWAAPRETGPQAFSELLENGLKKHPDSVMLLHNYGRLLRVCGRYLEAKEKLAQMARLITASGATLGNAALYDLVCCEWVTGAVSSAAAHVSALAASNVGFLADAYDWVEPKMDADAREAVRASLLEVLTQTTDDSATLRLRARLLKEQGRMKEAFKDLRRLVIKSTQPIAKDYVDVALASRTLGDAAYAYELLARGEKKFPDATSIPFRLGWMALEDGHHEMALEAFLRTFAALKACGVEPSASALEGLACSQWLTGDETGAIEILKQLCAESPDSATDLARDLRKAGRLDLADTARRFIADYRFPSDSLDGLEARANALGKLNRMTECLELRKVLIAMPDATAYSYANLVYEARLGGDEALAARAYATGRETFPEADALPLYAGWSFIATGRGPEALAQFELSARLGGAKLGDALLHLGMASAQWLLGATEPALAEFGKAVVVDPKLRQEKALEAMEWTQEEWLVVNVIRIEWRARQQGI